MDLTQWLVTAQVASAISVQLLGVWNVSNRALARDDARARANMTRLQTACCGVGVASLLFLSMMPGQKADCARLRAGKRSTKAADAVLALIVVGMIYSVAMSVLPVIPATSCYKVVGGAGCGGQSGDDDDDAASSGLC